MIGPSFPFPSKMKEEGGYDIAPRKGWDAEFFSMEWSVNEEEKKVLALFKFLFTEISKLFIREKTVRTFAWISLDRFSP